MILLEQDQFVLAVAGVLVLFFLAVIGYGLGKLKGRGSEGFWLGLLLGPLGWLLILLFPAGGRKCPFCVGVIAEEAVVCRHCGSQLPERIPSLRR